MKAILGASTIGALSLSDPTFAAAQTFLGNAANNAYGGQLQVQITVDNGKITAITTPVTPGGRNAQYSNYAVPTLTERALTAQSAAIQGVSGASAISSAWKQSLASAISKAGSAIGSQGSTTTTPAPVATPTKSAVPAPVISLPPRGGNDDGVENHEGFENHEGGDNDGNGFVRPHRSPRPRPTGAPANPIVPKATPAPTSTSSTTDLGLTPHAGVILKSITCVKGKLTKTVKAKNPKCPTGYTLKKK